MILQKEFLKSHPNTSIEIIDKNFMMLKESNTKNNILKSNKINLICGDGENIPLNDNSIDVITLSFGIRNMTDRIKCLEECYRVLKPGVSFYAWNFLCQKIIL